MSADRPCTQLVIRRVMLSQFLFMAGNSLTVGGFFNYFVNQFHPSGLLMAAAMIAPETSQSLSVLGRAVMLRFPDRKRNWIVFLIAGRLAAMSLTLTLFWPPASTMALEPLLLILGCTVVWYLLQGIAYVNYISWLSDLVPDVQWGRLFSRRQMAGLLVSLGMPFVVVWLRKHLLLGLPVEAERWSYGVLFLTGGMLTLTSLLPLLRFEEIPWKSKIVISQLGPRPQKFLLQQLSKSFLFLLASRWWLAFFQGMTQAVFFKYAVNTLQISLPMYTTLTSLMLLLQLPLAWWGGVLSDRFQEKPAAFWSMLAVSLAVPFWMMATPESWLLICFAYVLWGGFGMLNVCGQNLCLKLAPTSDNSLHFALYDQVAGLVAGLAGLLGGFWLDQMLRSPWQLGTVTLSPYLVLFTISWLGRTGAAFWLLPVRQVRAVE